MNPVDLMTKPLSGSIMEQLMRIMGYKFVRPHLERKMSRGARLVNSQQSAERTSARMLGHPPRVRALGVIDCGGRER